MRSFRLAALALPFAAVASAQAADLPNRGYAPPPVAAAYVPPVFSWTGFYVGLNAGYGWGSLGNVGNNTFGKPSGFVLGGTVGYNHQINQFVIGVEGDINWSGMDSTNRTIVAPASTVVNTAEVKWTGTLRARAGIALDRALLFVTGGYAGASVDTKFIDLNPAVAVAGSESNWRNGWAVGGGIEYAFSRNISAKTEYLYSSFGSQNVFTATPYASRAELSTSQVRAGVNYRF